ncbi:MAG: tRNA (adenosine(37)-N6)-dimethylallyltransferase MiaA [Candidatus Colwellbacteria bacterium RIFCSPHIGHO2_12_FULL_43_12]|uniref:tRNA dimethylallyltransferase n=3 Tax=Candidatus Colwelliibacteriota TaxID=1817904 RepID=A0A1G1YYG6_9BACT|nr:MAG: tRNA (adenosine(37)-N6)-dimethylallyltransferase MiaA [Candidatus Colwellbacteria bacterium RIFCSPHIGHO2_02_FULL_43_15]OGY58373.1 MAG: tRNA (adenosine(37)-N6)-dimethylallyltransferase MiaA [Candidatus Colwellbacteria bacterium RIFCSPHIGHO2_12_FULL_43_12]OGY61298.1 MAG: tRNA (adenosine(37)-N6)-dimethylallyltransferase MiaA [Candidatus Colwellbacteria bacterium RIFCSPLOWO2_12_FULL_43_11]
MKRNKIVVIVGPTSSGKSDLAVLVAKRFRGEVVSADSRQVYKGMDIGSGKITRKEMKGVRHHLLGVASPKSTFTVVKYKKLAEKAIADILKRKRLPIICGGTGFYIDSLLYDWHMPKVAANKSLRDRLNRKSGIELFKMLSGLDPERAKNIDRHNKVRLVRALEIVITTGAPVPKTELFNKKESLYEFLKIGIKVQDKVLKEKIKIRLGKRLKEGLIKEVEKLHRQGLSWNKLDNFGLEYRYISRYLRGLVTKEDAISTIEKENWHYAKRQMTWFRRDKNTIWINSPEKAKSLVKLFVRRHDVESNTLN